MKHDQKKVAKFTAPSTNIGCSMKPKADGLGYNTPRRHQSSNPVNAATTYRLCSGQRSFNTLLTLRYSTKCIKGSICVEKNGWF
ncbi:unnamed protein product [Acanthoscelides obtectus]|uniref:Uncharacterized protein n=1 Tax=Acanthoscelides obtectus TaxID=200917 RepID=A0A9P0PK15_ACAOB|nr:unnamed protein product [Acanthoscelides obtectus]CAK1624662.1 hypothetical protein AOBTE_LOCUS2681 [Acanthoscelides obtectus]